MESTCETCRNVSENLSVFHQWVPEHLEHKKDVGLLWTFQLSKTIVSARQGCQFCAFITSRFFEKNNLFSYGNISMTSEILGRSTISNLSQNEQGSQASDAFTDALKLSENLEDDCFTFSLKPSHSKGNSLPDLDKIEIGMWNSEMDTATLNKHFPYRRPITIEVYAVKGMSFAESSRIFILSDLCMKLN